LARGFPVKKTERPGAKTRQTLFNCQKNFPFLFSLNPSQLAIRVAAQTASQIASQD
jgi:hypothetical protein